MKTITNIKIIILLFYSFAFSQTGKISVQIDGFKNNNGLINIILFNQSKGFPSEYKYGLASQSLPIDSSIISITFDSLSYGEYALSVLHDENNNGKMDTNFLGIPKEGYGVSNNIRPKMRPPRFDEALFSLKEPQKIIKIILYYR
jgi:uncharacterized protein (DUF2141 family)